MYYTVIGYPKRGGWFCLVPNLDMRGGIRMEALTIISIVVGFAGLLVGLIQLLLSIIHDHKDKKNHR